MYEPIVHFIQRQTESFIEGELLKVTQEMGLDVDREELLKALKYDRGQYEKGYADGCRVSRKHGRWDIGSRAYKTLDEWDEEIFVKCNLCGREEYVPFEFEDQKMIEYAKQQYPYCHCGAKMDGGNENG